MLIVNHVLQALLKKQNLQDKSAYKRGASHIPEDSKRLKAPKTCRRCRSLWLSKLLLLLNFFRN